MDPNLWIPVLSVMYSWMFCTALAAPAARTSPAVHVRNKRCSCATFLDKECVYFCHLDIIWVNTPERVVSYGMGNAPRARRALADSMVTGHGPRCQCLRETDRGCRDFCLRHDRAAETPLRSPEDAGCAGARCGHAPGADTGGTERMKSRGSARVPLAALRAALRAARRTRRLPESWRPGRRHRPAAP
ncbi:endothelin-1 [Odontesthes bonariensis]|uniref:endothelin-1 n=1 Tax=Odontesthes bonariensis TaxID=219752 RepID=UPI003F588EBD